MCKEEKSGKEGKEKKRKGVTICEQDEDTKMEEGNIRTSMQMPNLPKPLTLEEKKFLLAVERGDCNTARKMLQKAHRHPDYMNMNCVDPLGRSALHMAISNENLEMLELLVVMGVETRDSLLHAIDAEFVEAVEVLLEHEEVIHKEGELYSWEKTDRHTSVFTPEITPLILAAHRDNYEILKILLDRGAMLPMPHDIRCGCPECIKTSSEDSLRHSRSRIGAYRALASPSLIALSSTDPILTAFELSWELKNLAYTEHEFRADYLELRHKCMDFAQELLSHTRSSTELAVILNHDPDTVSPYEDGEHMMLKRLELAIDYKQKKFVAHPNIQQLLAALWYEGVPGFRRKTLFDKCFTIGKVIGLFPAYCMIYILAPDSVIGKLMRTPFMKFLTHSASYLFFLLLLILVSVRFENLVIWLLGTDAMRLNLEEAMRRQRGNLPTPIECLVVLWVFGFLWEEAKEIHDGGLQRYLRNMWNILDIMRDILYTMTMILRVGAYIQQSQEILKDSQTAFIPREEWSTFDPQLVSEGLFAAANILSALKLVHIFSINPYLGPLQISLGRMVIDIVKFFFIYTLVLFAFACGLTQLLWYYNDLEKEKCYSLPGGMPDWVKQGDACMKWRRWHNLFEASQSLFWAGFGMVGLDDFELTGIREYTRFWSMLMFGAYSVINIIVLLNLLIAMMSSSYSFIVEHADTEWKFARTKLWMSYFEEGNTLPPPFNIFPTPKGFSRLCGKTNKKTELIRRMSSRTARSRRKARDYRYLSVMRALIWRYVCSLQRRNEERPVNEDDISEVKGDISSLRFELIDLFGSNGMDVSMCAKKSRAALGRKMRVWERRLMRDFHVSPAMGSEDTLQKQTLVPTEDETPGNKFRRVARLALIKAQDSATTDGKHVDSQIGMGDDSGRESLKVAMERARKKMEEGTPDGSPGSSRGCSPFPDLYTGPHLLDAIKNLDLTPDNSPAESPMPPYSNKPWSPPSKKDGQAKDTNMLTVPGRRSPSQLKKNSDSGANLSLDVPTNLFKDSLKKAANVSAKKEEKSDAKKDAAVPKPEKQERKAPAVPPATVMTISEKTEPQMKKDLKNLPVKEDTKILNVKEDTKILKTPDVKKEENKVQKAESQYPTSVVKPEMLQIASGALRPSQIKASGILPVADKSPAVKIPPPASSGYRRGPAPFKTQHQHQHQHQHQQFTGNEDLESVDFVRRPSRPAPKESSPEKGVPAAPAIAVTPSTPAPSETPVPPSPPAKNKISSRVNPCKTPPPTIAKPVEKSVTSTPEERVTVSKPVEKTAAPKPPGKATAPTPVDKSDEQKPSNLKPADKPVEQKPSTPPAATFQSNISSSQSEPLITQSQEKKGGWL